MLGFWQGGEGRGRHSQTFKEPSGLRLSKTTGTGPLVTAWGYFSSTWEDGHRLDENKLKQGLRETGVSRENETQ